MADIGVMGTQPQPAEKKSKGLGCFLYGCLSATVIVIVGCIVLYFVLTKAISKAVEAYTDTSPLALPKIQEAPEKYAAIKEKFDAFNKSVESNTATGPLVMTSNDINTLIALSPDLKNYRNRFYVDLQGSEI